MEVNIRRIEERRVKDVVNRLAPICPPKGHSSSGNLKWSKPVVKALLSIVEALGKQCHFP